MISTLFGSHEMDERFLEHRYRASRFALIMGMLALGGLILYDQFTNDIIRVDLWAVVAIIALAKLGAMAFYRLTR